MSLFSMLRASQTPHYNHFVAFCYVRVEIIHRIKFLRYYLKALIRSSGSCPSRLEKMVDTRCNHTYAATVTRLSCHRMASTRILSSIAGDCVHFFLSIWKQGGRRLSTRKRSQEAHTQGW